LHLGTLLDWVSVVRCTTLQQASNERTQAFPQKVWLQHTTDIGKIGEGRFCLFCVVLVGLIRRVKPQTVPGPALGGMKTACLMLTRMSMLFSRGMRCQLFKTAQSASASSAFNSLSSGQIFVIVGIALPWPWHQKVIFP